MRAPLPMLRHRFAADSEGRRRFAFLVLGIFALIGWGSLLFFSDVLAVREVVVEGGRGIDPIEAKAAVFQLLDQRTDWRPWSTRHRWFIDESQLAEQLKVRWYAQSMEVKTNAASNIVRLIMTEQVNSIIVKTPTQFLRVDVQGIVREELNPTERLQVLQRMAGRPFEQTSSTEAIIELPTLTDTVAPRYRLPFALSDIRAWFDVNQLLQQQRLSVAFIRVEDARLDLYSAEAIPTYIDPSQNVLEQIKAVQEFNTRVSKRTIEPAKEFIDARIPGRLYVK